MCLRVAGLGAAPPTIFIPGGQSCPARIKFVGEASTWPDFCVGRASRGFAPTRTSDGRTIRAMYGKNKVRR
jgi:hypothetical protein